MTWFIVCIIVSYCLFVRRPTKKKCDEKYTWYYVYKSKDIMIKINPFYKNFINKPNIIDS